VNWMPKTYHLVGFARWAPRRTAVAQQGWVEVYRRGFAPTEGSHIEGWLHPLLPPYTRGSGIFLNVGRSLVFPNRQRVKRWCRFRPNCSRKVRFGFGDALWAQTAHDLGYYSLQILSGSCGLPEIIVAKEGCLNQTVPLGPCMPPDVELRTVDRAQLKCMCVEYDAHGLPTREVQMRVAGLMNCDGGGSQVNASLS